MSTSYGMPQNGNDNGRPAALDNQPISANPLCERYPEIRVDHLTEDERFWLYALYESSYRFKVGKSEHVSIHHHMLRTFHDWDHSRIATAITGLKTKEIIVSRQGGLVLKVADNRSARSRKKKKKPVAHRSFKPGTNCAFCKKRLTPKNATLDHVIPKSRGGGEGSNLVRACFDCNQMKGDRTPHEWANDILTYRKPNRKDSLPPWRFRAIIQLRIWLVLALGVAQ